MTAARTISSYNASPGSVVGARGDKIVAAAREDFAAVVAFAGLSRGQRGLLNDGG